MAPTHPSKNTLTIGGLGNVDWRAAELVVLKAQLCHALLPTVLSRCRTHSHHRGRQQHPSTEHHHDPGNNTAPHRPSFYHTPVLHPYQQVRDDRTGVSIGNVEAVLAGDLDELIKAYLRWRRMS